MSWVYAVLLTPVVILVALVICMAILAIAVRGLDLFDRIGWNPGGVFLSAVGVACIAYVVYIVHELVIPWF